tara:strand:- start:3937 stop:4446 length:510 start_codon:yes stop_codon:yes gene_type:complete
MRGFSSVGQSIRLITGRSWVQVPEAPHLEITSPYPDSSAGQSTGLLSRWSQVRILLGVLGQVMDIKAELARRLREEFDFEEVVESTAAILRGENVKKTYKYEKGVRTLYSETVTVKVQDRAKGLILLDAVAYNGELGLSPKKVDQGSIGELYNRFNATVDNRIVHVDDE